MEQPIRINPKIVLKTLLIIEAVLIVLNSLLWYLERHKVVKNLAEASRLFNLNSESNIPTTFSVLLLALCALLLALIALLMRTRREKFALHWGLLSLGFLYMAFDESAMLHELSMQGLTKTFGTGPAGIFTFSWVLLMVILVPLLVIVFLKFFRSLPPGSRRRFALAGLIYVVGSVGFEMLGGVVVHYFSKQSRWFFMEYTVEESLEMLGLIIFIYALLLHIFENYTALHLFAMDNNAV